MGSGNSDLRLTFSQGRSDGTLTDNITHAHVFIMSRSGFRSMQNTLYEKFSTGSSVILYDMGEGYGRKLASAFMKKGLGLEPTIREIERISSALQDGARFTSGE